MTPMVAATVDFYYSLQSPWTYLGFARFREIAARRHAEVRYRVIQMAPVFAASGGLPLAQRPRQRQAYRLMELRRWRDQLGLPLNLHPRFFPAEERLAAGMVIAHGQRGGDVAALSQALLTAVWAEERDIADPPTLRAIAGEQGADGTALLAAAASQGVLDRYDADTRAAIEAGVFGVPTFVIGDELFWGQDRLEFVARALEA
jgi:2-hydroxychromene-2-carboxylate isomerase